VADYEGRISNAGFEDRISAIRSVRHGMSDEFLATVDAADEGIVDRLDLALDKTLVVISTVVNPMLTPRRWIDDLVDVLDKLKVAVDALAGLEEVTEPEVNALSAAVEGLTGELFYWPRSADADWREAVTQAASTYRRSAGQQLASLYAEIEEAGQELAAIREEAQTLSASNAQSNAEAMSTLHDRLEEFSVQMSALDTQRQAISDQVARSAERADQAIARFQEQFSAAQEARTTEHQARLNELATRADEARSELREKAEADIAAINAQVAEAEDLVSVFAAGGTANAYSKEANDQAKLADTWRGWAIVLAVTAAIATATLLFTETGKDGATNWSVVIGKAAIGLALGGLASYAARQSARHRAREEAARRLELIIVAFGPFARELTNEEKQDESRIKVMDAIFLRPVDRPKLDGGTKSITDEQINMLGKLFDLFTRRK
jgi:hypothetical protein